jgi:hypothetical protein
MQVNKKTTALKLIPGGLNTLTGGNTMSAQQHIHKPRPERQEYSPGDYDDFTQKGSKVSKTFVSILPRGGFSFSSGAVHEHQLNRFDFVLLGYSAKLNKIRFKFNNTRDVEGNMGVIKSNSSFVVPSVSFFKWHGLDLSQIAARYDLHEIDYNAGVYVLDLNYKVESLPERHIQKEQQKK